MNIINKLTAKAADNSFTPGVTIAFLGDSVTQGCFDLMVRYDTGFDNVYDQQNAYPADVARILGVLYPTVPVNVINAGVAGKDATHGLERLERDVLSHKPDLTVVCFGLNDCGKGEEGLGKYIDALGQIFDRIIASGSEVIYMTPNMMAYYVSRRITSPMIREIAENVVNYQQSGLLSRYVEAAREVCNAKNVPVCDCYQIWTDLRESGVNTTNLLANYINHPSRSMHWLFAYELVRTMFS